MFDFFPEINLISHNQLRFKQVAHVFNQVISIINEIYKLLDNNFLVCAVFLDISKAFANVWHKGFLYKLK